jgi:elongation factor P
MLTTADFKKGLRIEIGGEPFLVLDYTVQTPSARGSATLVKAKVRNILTGAVFDKTFKSGEKFDEPDLQMRNVQYLYREGDDYNFMDTASYEQFHMPAEKLGDQAQWLVENCTIRSILFRGNVIGVELPQFVEIRVVEVEPSAKSDTASGNQTKAATLETGATIRVPIYLKEGESVEVETETGRFVKRVNR